MIKMVVVDLDETLLRTDKSISRYTINMIEKIRNQGVERYLLQLEGTAQSYWYLMSYLMDIY